MLRLGLTIALWAAHGTAATAKPTSNLARGFAAYRAGEYHDAAKALHAALGEKLRNEDWAAFLLGESEFYDGDYRAARAAFERASHAHGGRPGAMAPFRIADCLWMEGDQAAAAKAYAGLVKKATPTTGDVVAGALSDRRGSGRARSGRRQEAASGDRARLSGASAGRRGAAPSGHAGSARAASKAVPSTKEPAPPAPRRRTTSRSPIA